MEFRTVHGTQEERPNEYEVCGEIVYVRKNIRRVTIEQGEDQILMWEYEEARCTLREYVQYNKEVVEERFAEIEDALCEISLDE